MEDHRGALLQARQEIPALLDLFEEFHIHATWAVVGFLFFSTRAALLEALPSVQPAYDQPHLSPYPELHALGADEDEDPCHFAPSLIELIRDTPHQEIGTHTFSHYYCRAPGHTREAFKADLDAAMAAAKMVGLTVRSIVFPRNQVEARYLPLLSEVGITAYRGGGPPWFYAPGPKGPLRRGLYRLWRLVDSYVPTYHHAPYPEHQAGAAPPFNVRASRPLRPPSPRGGLADRMQLRRVKQEMTRAARTRQVYHLWWHPESLGRHPLRTREHDPSRSGALRLFAGNRWDGEPDHGRSSRRVERPPAWRR